MKKFQNPRLLAALAAVFAAPALQAADVQMFGFFDQGLAYLHEDLNAGMGGPAGQSLNAPLRVDADGYVAREGTKSTTSLGTGNVSTWGVKGVERITDDLSVRFHLESGFLADDGTLYGGSVKPLFERESTVGFESKTWGLLKMGRMPALSSGSGTTGVLNSRVNPFGAGWGNMTGGWKFAGTLAAARHDNMIHYVSPSINGLRLHAQYSLKSANDDTKEGSSKTNRWWAVGATHQGAKHYVAFTVDCLDAAVKAKNPVATYADDAYKVFLGGHYDFDLFKLYGTVQYMKHQPWLGGYSTKEVAPLAAGSTGPQKGFEAWAFSTGADWRAAGGVVKFSAAYARAENLNLETKNKLDRVNLGAGYVYALSKRTSLYGIAGWFRQDADWQRESISAHEFIAGMMHRW